MKEKKVTVYTMYGNILIVPNFSVTDMEATELLQVLAGLTSRCNPRVGIVRGGVELEFVELKGEG